MAKDFLEDIIVEGTVESLGFTENGVDIPTIQETIVQGADGNSGNLPTYPAVNSLDDVGGNNVFYQPGNAVIQTFEHSNSFKQQLAYRFDGTEPLKYRGRDGNSSIWSDWRAVWDNSNLPNPLSYNTVNNTREPNELDTEFSYISSSTTDKPPFATTDGAVLTMIRPAAGNIVPRQLWWGRHGEIGIRANTAVSSTKPYTYEQWYQLATHDYVNGRGLQEITDTDNTTTNILKVTGSADPTFGTDGIEVFGGGVRRSEGSSIPSSIGLGSSGTSSTFEHEGTLLRLQVETGGSGGISGAEFNTRVSGSSAVNIGEFINGNNSGFGLSWNDTDNALDFGEEKLDGLNNIWHVIEIPDGEAISIGDPFLAANTPTIAAQRLSNNYNTAIHSGAHTTNNNATVEVGSNSTEGYWELIATTGAGNQKIIRTLGETGIKVLDNINDVGLVGDADYSANIDPLAYAQQIYVDNKIDTGQIYTPTNVTINRSFDADTVVIADLADVVGTLIADLQSVGILQ